jgi:hypothetical protein
MFHQETDSAVGSSISRIQRARALKNLEVLSESWKEWNKSIQVRLLSILHASVNAIHLSSRTSETH